MSVAKSKRTQFVFKFSCINKIVILGNKIMNIRELILAVDRYQDLSEAKPKVKPDGKGGFVNAETGEPAADNTVPFPSQGQSPAQEPAAAAAGPTGDATLDQPLPPKDPNAPSFGKKAAGVLGKIGKGIGAVASVPQGIGRAIKKGYQSGLQNVGGPGAAPAGGARQSRAGAAASGGSQQGGGAGDAEVNDLRQMINRLDARLTAAGIKETKKSVK